MVEKQCCDPNALQVPCVNCGTTVFTCEREEPVNNSYLCPAHPDGFEDGYGHWFCGNKCWNGWEVTDERYCV